MKNSWDHKKAEQIKENRNIKLSSKQAQRNEKPLGLRPSDTEPPTEAYSSFCDALRGQVEEEEEFLTKNRND